MTTHIAYRADRIIQGGEGHVVEGGVVVVEGERIVFVGSARSAPTVAETVDLGDATLLPGMIDAHVHLVWSAGKLPHEVVDRESRYLTVLRSCANLTRHLRAGVTTVRDTGSTDGIAIDLALAVAEGVVPGPRVVAAGRAVTMTGGHGWFFGREADGGDAVRHAVRSELKAGAQVIKLMASGGVYGHAEEIGQPQLEVAEMSVGVGEAHKAGRKVTAHAYSPQAMTNALDAGVDCIEHGSFMDGALADRMRRQGTYLVPTLSVYQAMHENGPRLGTPDYIRRKTAGVIVASRSAFKLALEAGLSLAAGTDCGSPGHPHGVLVEELALMVELGATPAQAIGFATLAAADLLGLAEEIGTLEPGKRADLIGVRGNPLVSIDALRQVLLVVRDGVRL